MSLSRRIYLDPNLIAKRTDQFPIIAELLGERLTVVLDGKRRRADSAPMLLRLLERTGENSEAMLALFSEGIANFDTAQPPGWPEWRGSLSGLDRTALMSRYFELLTAMWFTAAGYEVRQFEPAGAPGKRTDLLVALGDEPVQVEATSPGPHQNDWVDDAMDHLTDGLSRVESGLVIDVRGYESVSLDPTGGWKLNPKVGAQQQEAVIVEFAKAAEKLDLDQLPQVIVEPSADQPVEISAREYHAELTTETLVAAGWSRSGLVPNVKRLAGKILDERKHLPDDLASMILVDFSRWHDFRNADYYLCELAKEIAGRTDPACFVGTCVGTFVGPKHGLIERGVLATNLEWQTTELGRRFTHDWKGKSVYAPPEPPSPA
jgi:hypothetical protein